MLKQNFKFLTKDKEPLRITAYGDVVNISRCIIYIHGFKGFKDWGFGPYVCEYLAYKGFYVIAFNFSHNGIGDNPLEFTELEKFANNTYSREINETSEIIDALLNNYFGAVENPKIGLLGHSRGGAIALLTAAKRKEVDAVSVWASISKVDRYNERQKIIWKAQKYLEMQNQRTGQNMQLNLPLLEDIEKNSETTLNIKNAVEQLNRPLLIVHGEQDLTVPIKEAEELLSWSNREITELYRINATGHTFDIKHPFEGCNKKFNDLLDKTTLFFTDKLK